MTTPTKQQRQRNIDAPTTMGAAIHCGTVHVGDAEPGGAGGGAAATLGCRQCAPMLAKKLAVQAHRIWPGVTWHVASLAHHVFWLHRMQGVAVTVTLLVLPAGAVVTQPRAEPEALQSMTAW